LAKAVVITLITYNLKPQSYSRRSK